MILDLSEEFSCEIEWREFNYVLDQLAWELGGRQGGPSPTCHKKQWDLMRGWQRKVKVTKLPCVDREVLSSSSPTVRPLHAVLCNGGTTVDFMACDLATLAYPVHVACSYFAQHQNISETILYNTCPTFIIKFLRPHFIFNSRNSKYEQQRKSYLNKYLFFLHRE